MLIEFMCPNGHQLSAPEHMAGKPSKCPRCGTKFLVPTLEELREEPDFSEPAAPPVGGAGGVPASPWRTTGETSPGSGKAAAETTKTGSGKASTATGPTAGSGSRWAEGSGKPTPGSGKSTGGGAPTAGGAPASGGAPAGGGGSSAGAPTQPGTPRSDVKRSSLPPGMFVFLCPNNHKLNGPVSLKGKPGQCPHCGAKFRIPADDDTGEVETAAPGTPTAAMPAGSGPIAGESAAGSPPLAAESIVETDLDSEEIPSVEPISIWQLPPPPAGQGHRLAELFHWVWSQREPRSVIELTFKDNTVLTPKWFAPELSLEGYGAFAVQDEYGRYTLTFVPWDSIAQLSVRNLEEIPPQYR